MKSVVTILLLLMLQLFGGAHAQAAVRYSTHAPKLKSVAETFHIKSSGSEHRHLLSGDKTVDEAVGHDFIAADDDDEDDADSKLSVTVKFISAFCDTFLSEFPVEQDNEVVSYDPASSRLSTRIYIMQGVLRI